MLIITEAKITAALMRPFLFMFQIKVMEYSSTLPDTLKYGRVRECGRIVLRHQRPATEIRMTSGHPGLTRMLLKCLFPLEAWRYIFSEDRPHSMLCDGTIYIT